MSAHNKIDEIVMWKVLDIQKHLFANGAHQHFCGYLKAPLIPFNIYDNIKLSIGKILNKTGENQ